MTINIHQGDCLEIIPTLTQKFRLMLCDLPWGIKRVDKLGFTDQEQKWDWDNTIDLDKFSQVWDNTTDDGTIIHFAGFRFANTIIRQKMFAKYFRYDLIWDKGSLGNPLKTHWQPGIRHEMILVFQKKCHWNKTKTTSILEYKRPRKGRLHPTEKPVALLEYLIKTYSNEGDFILDPTAGSFSTGVACVNTGRSFVGIEMDETYYKIGCERLGVKQW